MKYFMVVVFVLLVSSTAFGECLYNGKYYPTGTVLGPLVCAPDGTWQQK